MVIKYPKRLYDIPNDHKIHQPFPTQNSPKFTQMGIFGLKRNHLATLMLIVNLSTFFAVLSMRSKLFSRQRIFVTFKDSFNGTFIK
jgi:hypothetical protein